MIVRFFLINVGGKGNEHRPTTFVTSGGMERLRNRGRRTAEAPAGMAAGYIDNVNAALFARTGAARWNMNVFTSNGVNGADDCKRWGAGETVYMGAKDHACNTGISSGSSTPCPNDTHDLGVTVPGGIGPNQSLCFPPCGLTKDACGPLITGAPGGMGKEGLCPVIGGVRTSSGTLGGPGNNIGSCNYDIDTLMKTGSAGPAGSAVRQWVDRFGAGGGAPPPPGPQKDQYDVLMGTYCLQLQSNCPGAPPGPGGAAPQCSRVMGSAAVDGDLCRRWYAGMPVAPPGESNDRDALTANFCQKNFNARPAECACVSAFRYDKNLKKFVAAVGRSGLGCFYGPCLDASNFVPSSVFPLGKNTCPTELCINSIVVEGKGADLSNSTIKQIAICDSGGGGGGGGDDETQGMSMIIKIVLIVLAAVLMAALAYVFIPDDK